MTEIPTNREVNRRDWECLSCGLWYAADNDAARSDLPDFCPECGGTPGWINVADGRKLPDYE